MKDQPKMVITHSECLIPCSLSKLFSKQDRSHYETVTFGVVITGIILNKCNVVVIQLKHREADRISITVKYKLSTNITL